MQALWVQRPHHSHHMLLAICQTARHKVNSQNSYWTNMCIHEKISEWSRILMLFPKHGVLNTEPFGSRWSSSQPPNYYLSWVLNKPRSLISIPSSSINFSTENYNLKWDAKRYLIIFVPFIISHIFKCWLNYFIFSQRKKQTRFLLTSWSKKYANN